MSQRPRYSTVLVDSDDEGEIFVDMYDNQNPKITTTAKICAIGFSVLAVLLLVALIYIFAAYPFAKHCNFKDSDYITPRNLDNPGVFDELTSDEYTLIYGSLNEISEFHLKPFEEATVDSNYLYMIELHIPKKDSVLSFLDESKQQPPREAIATVVLGNVTEPSVVQYIVTLNDTHPSFEVYKTSNVITNSAPYLTRPLDRVDINHLFSRIIVNATADLYGVLVNRYNLYYHNCTRSVDCLRVELDQDQTSTTRRLTWARMYSSSTMPYSYPLGLDILIDHTSTNTKEWKIMKIYFENKEFNTILHLLESFDKNVDTTKPVNGLQNMPSPTKQPKQGPKFIEPEGKRFTIRGQQVMYGMWNIVFHMSPSRGLVMYNTVFNGTRIAYEISLQDITPSQTSFIGPQLFGETIQELVRGVDCPDTALYITSTMLVNSQHPRTIPNSICVFENNGGTPYRRHFQKQEEGSFGFYYAIEDYYLIVRSIATIGDYDYILDYSFRNSGEISVTVSTSGYPVMGLANGPIFGNKYTELNSVNGQTFLFKTDIDVNGQINRASKVSYELPSVGPQVQPKLVTTTLSSEKMNTPYNYQNQQYFILYNGMAEQSKSYKIVNNSPVKPRKASPVVITQRKDNEADINMFLYRTRSGLSDALPDKISDGDILLDQDLVAWVTIGTNHLVSREDIPATSSVHNKCSFSILPHNYFSESASSTSTDNVWIHPSIGSNRNIIIDTFDRSFNTICFQKSTGPVEYSGNISK